jgi:virulence-associated protein VapD
VDNKVNVRGFLQAINIKEFNALKAPVRSIPAFEPITDDNRFSLEISSMRALNDDIMNILASLDFFDQALGRPELQFAGRYPDLEDLREVYFNRLTSKINYKNLLEFYKWFDDSLAQIVIRMLPRNTDFLGINFVIESHALERHKLQYFQGDIYLGENNRRGLATDIFLQQVVGTLKRY